MLDGWSSGSTYYVGVIANFNNDAGLPAQILLGFSPLLVETSMSASEHLDYLNYLLTMFGKNMSNVVCLICDNCETNKALARLCRIPMIGCASHRFNLAVKEYILTSSNSENLSKINVLIGKLKGIKLGAKLRQFTTFRPKQQNVTRWSSSYEMVSRYLELKQILEQHFSS